MPEKQKHIRHFAPRTDFGEGAGERLSYTFHIKIAEIAAKNANSAIIILPEARSGRARRIN